MRMCSMPSSVVNEVVMDNEREFTAMGRILAL